VALDLALTPSLIAAGQVREVIRFLQEMRKSEGFEISDRIIVLWNAHPSVVQAISQGAQEIAREVLATAITLDTTLELGENELGLRSKITKA